MGIGQLVFVVGVVLIALSITRMMKPKQEYGGSQDVAFADSVLSVSVSNPQGINFTPHLTLTGTVAAQTETQIAPQVNGRVVWVNQNLVPGATVEKDELLFRIEDEDFKLALEQADANIAASMSDLKVLEAEAKVALSEWTDLYPDRAISDLGARKPQIQAANARLTAARASKKTAELALKRTQVTSPARAKILTTSLDVGQLVSPSMPVGSLYGLDNVEIVVPLSPEDLQLLTPIEGRKVVLKLENGRQSLEGVVSRLASILDPRTRQATAYIKPVNVEGLTIGSFVNAQISASAVNGALQIPITALSGRDQVWVIQDGQLKSRSVNVLGQTPNSIIVNSFDIGEGVLTLPPAEAYEGQKAKIRSKEG